MKLRGHYEKPSEKKAREKAEAVRRAAQLARKKLQSRRPAAYEPSRCLRRSGPSAWCWRPWRPGAGRAVG